MNDDVLKCDLCKKSFSGVVPYSQHLKSAKHMKKKNQIELEAVSKLPVTEEGKLCCTLCNMKFSGVIPFQQHMNGSTHMKNVRRQEVMKDICRNLDSNQAGSRILKDKKRVTDDGYFSCSSSSSGGGSTCSSINSSRFNSNSSQLLKQSLNLPSLDPSVELQKQLYECSNTLPLHLQSGFYHKHCELPKHSVPFSIDSNQWDSRFLSSDSASTSTSRGPEVDQKMQGCTLCGIPSFRNQEEIIKHLESDEHFIQKLKNIQLRNSPYLPNFEQ